MTVIDLFATGKLETGAKNLQKIQHNHVQVNYSDQNSSSNLLWYDGVL